MYIVCVCRCYCICMQMLLLDLKINSFLRQSISSTIKILKEIAVLECENAKNF